MITEMLLVLPLYLTLFLIWWRFQYVIKAMTDAENILNMMTFLEILLTHQKKALSSLKNENA